MAGITLAQAETALAEALSAHTSIMERWQSYSIADRTAARPDLDKVLKAIDMWDAKVIRLGGKGITVKLGVPL